MSTPVVVWFRQDLRLADNPALRAAVSTNAPVLAVYVLNDGHESGRTAGAATRWWLHHSLSTLAARLERKGCPLVLRRGLPPDELRSIVQGTGASALYFNRCYEPQERRFEEDIYKLSCSDIDIHRFSSHLLFEPDSIRTKNELPFRVFTPFWKTCLAMPEPRPPLDAPKRINGYKAQIASDKLADWNLLPREPDWSQEFHDTWSPGEGEALDRIDDFIQSGIMKYGNDRDRPDRYGTSRMSPHLHFGEITPNQIWHNVRSNRDRTSTRAGSDAFLRELGWREFCHHLLYHWPSLPERPFREEFQAFPWRDDKAMLAAWQRGLTGYPIVDAGMRELWHTGWMHNRVRMIVASFLVKDLLIHWQHGEAWFWDTLVDADLANNVASWQWVAGCGADAAPYFRIFNPVLQGRKFDPKGRYVRKWVPELKQIPDAYIHAPWEAPAEVLRDADVELSRHYPKPVVDHAACRKRALDAYRRLKDKKPSLNPSIPP